MDNDVLLDARLVNQFPLPTSTMEIPNSDKVSVTRYFAPFSSFEWFPVEFDPSEGKFFGLAVTPKGAEWGLFHVQELRMFSNKNKRRVKRDEDFVPTKIKDIPGIKKILESMMSVK